MLHATNSHLALLEKIPETPDTRRVAALARRGPEAALGVDDRLTQLLERVKGDDRLKRAPVVVLTTTDDKVEIQRCYDLGCNVYITKPVDYESFAGAIRQLGLFLSVMQAPDIE